MREAPPSSTRGVIGDEDQAALRKDQEVFTPPRLQAATTTRHPRIAAIHRGIRGWTRGKHRSTSTMTGLSARLSSAFLFARLKPSPQRLYRIVLDKFREEDGHRLVCDMPRRVARRIIEEIGETRPSMARFTTTCCDRSRQPRRTGLHSLVHRMAVQ